MEQPSYSLDLSHVRSPEGGTWGHKFENNVVVEPFIRNKLDYRPPMFDKGMKTLPLPWEKCVTIWRDCVEK